MPTCLGDPAFEGGVEGLSTAIPFLEFAIVVPDSRRPQRHGKRASGRLFLSFAFHPMGGGGGGGCIPHNVYPFAYSLALARSIRSHQSALIVLAINLHASRGYFQPRQVLKIRFDGLKEQRGNKG
jgi:hypothetical protein